MPGTNLFNVMFSCDLPSVQFSCSVVSDCLWPRGLQHARLPCPSPIPGACSNSCPSSQWCHPTISSSVIPFSSCPQSFPASGSFPLSQFFTSGGQSIGERANNMLARDVRLSGLLHCVLGHREGGERDQGYRRKVSALSLTCLQPKGPGAATATGPSPGWQGTSS